MTRRLISSGSSFEREIGYSRAVVDGDWVHVSGTTGFDYATMTISDDVVEQAEQCLRNIEAALAEAGASLADVVRVRYYVPDAADWPCIYPPLFRPHEFMHFMDLAGTSFHVYFLIRYVLPYQPQPAPSSHLPLFGVAGDQVVDATSQLDGVFDL